MRDLLSDLAEIIGVTLVVAGVWLTVGVGVAMIVAGVGCVALGYLSGGNE